MARTRQTPAEVVIDLLGIRPLARELDIDPTTIVRWRKGAGLVPSAYHVPLLKLAPTLGVKLTEGDLIHGR